MQPGLGSGLLCVVELPGGGGTGLAVRFLQKLSPFTTMTVPPSLLHSAEAAAKDLRQVSFTSILGRVCLSQGRRLNSKGGNSNADAGVPTVKPEAAIARIRSGRMPFVRGILMWESVMGLFSSARLMIDRIGVLGVRPGRVLRHCGR